MKAVIKNIHNKPVFDWLSHLLCIERYAQLRGISVRTVYNKIESKEIDVVEIEGAKFIDTRKY